MSVATNASGVVVSNQHFDPWGKVRTGGVGATRRGFTGQYLDESGVMYYNARYYDPALGRFISPDTVVPGAGSLTVTPNDAVAANSWAMPGGGPGNPQELNRYSYALNNPARFSDPSGHEPCGTPTPGSACSAVAGGGSSGGGGGGGAGAGRTRPSVTDRGQPARVVRPTTPTTATRETSGANPAAAAAQAGAVRSTSGASQPNTQANTNPFTGPVDSRVITVDPRGNAILVNKGEQLTGSPDARFVQVRDQHGTPTGVRLDGAHNSTSHPDPRARVPHAHVPGVTNPDGTPWLPVR